MGNPQETIFGDSTEISFGGYWIVDINSNYNNSTGKFETFNQIIDDNVIRMKSLGGPPYNVTEKDVNINGINGKEVSYFNKGQAKPNVDIYLPVDSPRDGYV